MTTLNHVIDIEQDLGISLIGAETEKKDFEECPVMHGDNISYPVKEFTRTTFSATGFRLSREGVTISGNFASPVDVVMVETNEHGEVTDTEYHEGDVARAVLTKLDGIPDGQYLAMIAKA